MPFGFFVLKHPLETPKREKTGQDAILPVSARRALWFMPDFHANNPGTSPLAKLRGPTKRATGRKDWHPAILSDKILRLRGAPLLATMKRSTDFAA